VSGFPQDLSGRVAVITGGASGIGRALGRRFAAEGARVVLVDVEAGALAKTAKELAADCADVAGADVTEAVCDVTDPASVESLAESVYASHGAVHVLCNNAGVGPPSAKVWETTPNDWAWVHSVNVFGVAHGIQSFVPRMLAAGEPGHIVNTSSGDGAVNPLPGASVYAASKAAVATLTECLATQLAAENARIGVSLFLPGGGLLDTGMWTAERNRPAHLARERPRTTPVLSVQQVVKLAAERGQQLPIASLDDLAARVVAGIRAGTYLITEALAANAATLHKRADLIAAGRCPLIQEDHGIMV
jgi:NAD(P)-dependent dehydrogenase (short-subunit alcohol dehydrogenase family)